MQPELIADRYRVVREIGRGGMGTVWLCRDERLERDVAVKQVGGFPGESRPQIQRALREARSAAALQHPGVVSVFDAIEEGEHIWLVMEYVPSKTLSQLTRDEGPLSPRRVAGIGAQIAAGLAAAHARGIVHRDVKPGNVLVAEGDRAKISDFGIARVLGDEQLTQTGLVTGTPAYFSPELARGGDPSAASDVWALGATLYAAVEGESPYPERTNAIALLTQIATEAPRRPQRAGPLNEAIGRMMTPDPDSRWSMAEAADALRRIAAAPEPDVAPTRRDSVRTATPVLPAAGAVAAGAAPASAGGQGGRTRGGGVLVALLGLVLVAALLIGGLWLSQRDGGTPVAGPDPAASSPGSGEESPDDSEDGEDDESPSPEGESEETEDPAGEEPEGSPQEVVTDYYALLPDDPSSAWDRLSPELQDQVGSYGSYAGFWNTVDAVRVDGTTPVGDDQVDVRLTYTTDRGTESEVRRIRVGEADGEFVLTGDQVVG